MNKSQLALAVATRVGLTKMQVEKCIDVMTDLITDTIIGGDEVTLAGFGEFSARTRKGRIGVNPQNPSQAITIPSVKVPKFKAGSRLKKSVKTNEKVLVSSASITQATPAPAPHPVAEPPANLPIAEITPPQSNVAPNSFVTP